jgi:hypothetical protein
VTCSSTKDATTMKRMSQHLVSLLRTAGNPGRATLLGLIGIVGLAPVACGPTAESNSVDANPASHEFGFIRTANELIRLETRTGRVWRVPASGDGGWVAFGDTPSDGDKPGYKGRYRVQFMPAGRQTGAARKSSVARFDNETGRTWVADADPGSAWILISEAGGAPADAPPTPKPAVSIPPPPSASTKPGDATALELPSPADEPPLDLPPEQVAADMKAFAAAIDSNHLPSEIRVWSTEQLGRYDKQLAGPILLRALDDSDPKVVVAAIHATRRVGYVAGIPKIVALQNSANPDVRTAAQESVQETQ